jgi:hypothetical protein
VRGEAEGLGQFPDLVKSIALVQAKPLGRSRRGFRSLNRGVPTVLKASYPLEFIGF